MTDTLLGLPLDRALERLGDARDQYTVERTEPQRGRQDGELRVVRVVGHTLTVAPFYTQLGPQTNMSE